MPEYTPRQRPQRLVNAGDKSLRMSGAQKRLATRKRRRERLGNGAMKFHLQATQITIRISKTKSAVARRSHWLFEGAPLDNAKIGGVPEVPLEAVTLTDKYIYRYTYMGYDLPILSRARKR